MPSLNVDKIQLLDALRKIKKNITEELIESFVFDFGVELDDIYEEEGRTMYKFDISANRYDLLCFEGFLKAISCFICEKNIVEKINYSENNSLEISQENTHERPFIACAIIRDINFTKEMYDSFISYQEKLHSSIGRNRSLVAIGTHDLSKINGNITYKTTSIDSVEFQPLKSDVCQKINLKKFFSNDKKISKFFNLLSDQTKSVAFFDERGIISIPPIINSERTKIDVNTKDVFVEVTGNDLNKVNTTLNLICCNFPGNCIEKIRIGNTYTPVSKNLLYNISIDVINKKLCLNLDRVFINQLLEKMMYNINPSEDLGVICISVPDFRTDILHECDIIEDIAIAYGFNNFAKKTPNFYTVGTENMLNKFSDKLRQEMALSGYNEVLTLTLLSKKENMFNLDKYDNIPLIENLSLSDSSMPKHSDYNYHLDDKEKFNHSIVEENIFIDAVVLSNPKSKEYEVVRTSLIPGVLKSISSNLHGRIPIKMFEISDVVIRKSEFYNIRKACAVICSTRSLLEDLQGPLTLLLQKCGINNFEYINSVDYGKAKISEIYLENQNALIIVDGIIVGTLGVLNPLVTKSFDIPYACSAFEIDVQLLFNLYTKK